MVEPYGLFTGFTQLKLPIAESAEIAEKPKNSLRS